MQKRLTAVGNSLGLIIERPILDLLGIDRDTDLDMQTDGEGLIIRPIRGARASRLKAASKEVMKSHDDTFSKLAK
ncbi:MAG: AbrB/MazE/SpoVT family DNA-binding domain-containing protein [Myxococcota bacterium]|jgi:antitoxin component of MazEF toxin-antitoxin module